MSLLINPYRYATGAAALVSDTFTRADGVGLGNAETGQAWGTDASTFRIVSNTARQSLTPGSSYQFATINPGTADVDVVVHATPSNLSGNDFGVVVRFTDTDNHVLFDVTKLGGGWLCRVFEKVAGGAYSGVTTLQSPPAGLDNTFDPFRMRVVVNGTAGEAFLSAMADPLGAWNSMGTWTVNAALTANTVGLAPSESQQVAFDNFTVTAA